MKATVENIELFKKTYNPDVSERVNMENLEKEGLKISIMTVYRWADKYINGIQKETDYLTIKVPVELYDKIKEMINNK